MMRTPVSSTKVAYRQVAISNRIRLGDVPWRLRVQLVTDVTITDIPRKGRWIIQFNSLACLTTRSGNTFAWRLWDISLSRNRRIANYATVYAWL